MELGEHDVLVVLREFGADDKWIYRSAVVARLATLGAHVADAEALLDQMIEMGLVRRHPMEWNTSTPRVRLP